MRVKSFFIIFFCIFLFFTSCDKQDDFFKYQYDEISQTFSDGSYIRCKGGAEYEHILFDKYSIRWFGSKHIQINPQNISLTNMQKNCFVYRYTFNDNGYIAIHKMDLCYGEEEKNNTQHYYSRFINGQKEYVKKDELLLHCIIDDTTLSFNSLKELNDYCAKNKILLNEWYFCMPFGSKNGKNIELINGYGLFFYPFGYQSIQLNGDDIFYGYIDECFLGNEHIAFNLLICDFEYDAEFKDFVNKNLHINYDNFIGIKIINKKLKKLYYNKYVLIDTSTSKYQEFKNKKDLMNYLTIQKISLEQIKD